MTTDPTEAEIEAAAANMYGKHWNGPSEKMPGPGMKEVWRRLSRLALEGAARVRATLRQELRANQTGGDGG